MKNTQTAAPEYSPAFRPEKRKNGRIFSRRMVLVYTLIVTIPLSIAILIGTERFWNLEYHRIITAAEADLKENVAHSLRCIELFMRFESVVISNRGMDDLFLFTDKTDKAALVFQIWDLCDELERLQFASPQVGIRIFIDDPVIPERWPVLFHRERLQALGESSPETRWRYGYSSEIFKTDGAPMVSYTTGMLLRKRRVGELQILMPMADFFPFLERRDQRYFVFSGGELLGISPEESGDKFWNKSLGEPVIGELFQAAGKKENGVLKIRDQGRARYILWQRVANTELLFARDCAEELRGAGITSLRIAAGTGVVLSAILLFLVIRFVTGRMMGRLYRIMGSMGEIRRGNLDISIAEEGNDEISGMAQAFNNMVTRIRDLVTQITEEQRLVTETELRAMQNQINSHFLYNALETIRMQAELAEEPSIVESVTLLGRMLRYCLRSGVSCSAGGQVSVREELEYIRSYIGFLNIRNDYHITLKENLDPRCMDHRIPKMLIQPLIENAFHHAIEPEGENAIVELRIEKKDGILWISVRDYGPGIKAAGPAAGGTEKGIGLKNIQLRLSTFYGPQWKLRIENAVDRGTLVRIPIPGEAG
ncbi:MAG: histidine kinase [Treponema sp.]|nr:histidine kinase [Treponema sp.]